MGRPWTRELERWLRDKIEEGLSLAEIARLPDAPDLATLRTMLEENPQLGELYEACRVLAQVKAAGEDLEHFRKLGRETLAQGQAEQSAEA